MAMSSGASIAWVQSVTTLQAPVSTSYHHYEAEQVAVLPRLVASGQLRPLLPFYAVREVNRLRPKKKVWRLHGHSERWRQRVIRYRHNARMALFDGRGRQLTGYRFRSLDAIGPNQLVYSIPVFGVDAERLTDAIYRAGLPTLGVSPFEVELYKQPRYYGLLNHTGIRLTAPRYLCLTIIGPNTLWAVKMENERIAYSLIDTLGQVRSSFSPRPLSLPDEAGLLRRRSSPPVRKYSRDGTVIYADTATVSFYYADGRPAFADRFSAAGAFVQGRALVRIGTQYGLIDLQGRWVATLTSDAAFFYTGARRSSEDKADPYWLFSVIDYSVLHPSTK